MGTAGAGSHSSLQLHGGPASLVATAWGPTPLSAWLSSPEPDIPHGSVPWLVQ